MKKWLKALVAALMVASPSLVQAEDLIKIGIIQHVEHTAYDDNREGFINRLAEAGYVDGETIEIDYQNPSGNMATLQSMAERLISNSDYIFAIGTPALQTVANLTDQVPVFFSSVTDPVGAGAIASVEAPGGNISGTSNLGPIEEQVKLMLAIEPEIKNVGIIYNSGEQNAQYQVDKAVEILEAHSLNPVIQTISSTNDINQAMAALIPEVDAFFLVTDSMVHTGMSLVGELAKAENLGIYGASNNMIEENGLATFGLVYEDLGAQTADMLIRSIEEGIQPGEMPVEYAQNLELVINQDYAKAIGMDLINFEYVADESEQLSHE